MYKRSYGIYTITWNPTNKEAAMQAINKVLGIDASFLNKNEYIEVTEEVAEQVQAEYYQLISANL